MRDGGSFVPRRVFTLSSGRYEVHDRGIGSRLVIQSVHKVVFSFRHEINAERKGIATLAIVFNRPEKG